VARDVSKEPAIALALQPRHDRSSGDGIDDLVVVRKAPRGRRIGSRSLVRTSLTA
jgi:hypothetical protein